MKTLSKEAVIEIVQRHVDAHQPDEYRLVVNREGIRFVSKGVTQPDEYFMVVVEADRDVERRFEYYDRLSDIEDEIENQESIKVSLVPAMPG